MFQVSMPARTRKYWLTAVLDYLFIKADSNISAEEYSTFLYNLAEKFLRQHFLGDKSYSTLIKEIHNTPLTIPTIASNEEDINKFLDSGTAVPSFIFNFLDYKIWKTPKDVIIDIEHDHPLKFRNFEFTYRNSVEHYYPQFPNVAECEKITDDDGLNNFGNLCLISSHLNSRLNNLPPTSKKEMCKNRKKLESLKQFLMMQHDSWTKEDIATHGKNMKDLLFSDIFKQPDESNTTKATDQDQ